MARNRTPVDPVDDADADDWDARPGDLEALFDHGDDRRRSLPGRLLRGLVVLAVLAVLAFYLGGGWYFSGRLRAQALDVAPHTHTDTLRLAPLGHGQVALTARDAGERAVLESGSTYGLGWSGGYGQVSGPARPGADGAVVRHLRVLAGGSPVAGTPAHLDVDAFPADPRRTFGPAARTVAYASGSHRLPAWFVPGPGDNSAGTWAILVHGKGDSRVAMLRLMRDTVAAGLPSLAISYRNDVGAPRDPSGYYQYGRTEWHDLAGAVGYARAHGADHVVLVGYSMGGGIVASYLEHAPTALPVRAVVMDAPMLDFAATVRLGARETPLPLLGHVPDSLTWVAERLGSLRFGVDWGATDYLADPSWLRAPALVLHGAQDATVPPATSARLRAERPGRVRLLTFPGAGHVESWNVDPHRYDAAVRSFLVSHAG
jgi:pimeloyl-ACP methyl ester carboxylesterase